jgi:dTDP-4-amino-4,6-dideoxygalactose transaminase
MNNRPIGVGGLVLGPREKAYLKRVIESNRLSYGPITQRFEQQFASLHECAFSVFCSSGTAALHLAVAALKEKYKWKDQDEVIVPSITFIATSNVVLHNGLRPVFVDVDRLTYNIDPAKVEAAITKRTRAIIPVHLMGLPCDMAPLLDIARRHNLRIIEDSCETMFARYKGRPVGSFGDFGTFSTYVAHFIVAGIGGFVTTNDRKLAVLARSLMNHGRDNIYISIDDDAVTGKKLDTIIAKRFSFIHLGHNFRATELEAAIGLGQLDDYESIVRKRQRNAKRFIRGLADLQEHLQLPTIPEGSDHVFMLFPIVVRNSSKRSLVQYLEHHGVETRDLMPLLSQPIYRRLFGNQERKYPVARFLGRSGFYIGCHQYLTDKDIDFVISLVHRFYAR